MTKDDNSINNPHDRFTRRVLGDIKNVRELITWRFPSKVLAALNLDTIRPAKESIVDKSLREGLSDLVFEVQLASGGEAYVAFLFEHKSSPDKMTAFQVLRYIVGINEQRERNGRSLRCVIPLVLYHGVEQWKVARSMRELISCPEELQCYVPGFTLPLLDLSQCSDQELLGESLFLVYMSLLKYIKRDELPDRLPEIFGLFRKLLPPATALESLETILRYIARGTDRVSGDDLTTAITEIFQNDGDSLMPTIAEQWKQEGRQEGRQEGLEQGMEKGEAIGRIRTLEEVIGRVVSSKESLSELSASELQRMTDELTQAMRDRS